MAGLLDRSVEAVDDDHWIGSRPSAMQLAAFLIVGAVGLIIAGVQPVVFGALISEHRLSAAELGWSTTIEFLTLGMGVGLAGVFFKPEHIRLRVIGAATLTLLIDLAITHQSGLWIVLDRAAAGLFEGVLVWATMLMVSRSATPARWGAIYLVAQGGAQLGFAATVPGAVIRFLGADGGFYALALTCVFAAIAAFALPNRMQALDPPKSEHAGPGLPAPALLSLLGVALIYAFFIGLFAYLGQLGAQAKLTEEQSGYAVAWAVGVSILGSGAAAIVAKRISYFVVFLICLPVNVIAMYVFSQLPHAPVFFAASAIFGFFWGFFMPFQLPFVIESDPSRRAALQVPGIQAVGGAAGPLICSFFVTNSEARGALVVAAICFFASFLIAAGLHTFRLLKRGATETVASV